jgi:hypothetical protein
MQRYKRLLIRPKQSSMTAHVYSVINKVLVEVCSKQAQPKMSPAHECATVIALCLHMMYRKYMYVCPSNFKINCV